MTSLCIFMPKNMKNVSGRGTIAAMHVVMLGLRLASANISGHGFLNPVKGYHLVPSGTLIQCKTIKISEIFQTEKPFHFWPDFDFTGIFDDITVATSVALQCYPQICNSKRPVLVINLDVYQASSIFTT